MVFNQGVHLSQLGMAATVCAAAIASLDSAPADEHSVARTGWHTYLVQYWWLIQRKWVWPAILMSICSRVLRLYIR